MDHQLPFGEPLHQDGGGQGRDRPERLDGNVADDAFTSARREFGERGVTDLTLLCGYFIALASVINALRIELESDRKPMMKPLA